MKEYHEDRYTDELDEAAAKNKTKPPRSRRMTATLPYWLAAAIREIHTNTGIPINRLKETIIDSLLATPDDVVDADATKWAWDTYLENTGPSARGPSSAPAVAEPPRRAS